MQGREREKFREVIEEATLTIEDKEHIQVICIDRRAVTSSRLNTNLALRPSR